MPKHPYTELPSTILGKTAYKAIVNIRLGYVKTHKITSSIIGLIDSGADVCLCDESIGQWLGIPFAKIKRKQKPLIVNGICGNIKTYREKIKIYYNNKVYLCNFYFGKMPSATPLLLGQVGFFEKFKVTFDYPNYFEITEKSGSVK